MTYTSAQALIDLGGKPSETEVKRLIQNFPTYQYPQRMQLLQDMFDGGSQEELVLGKITAKGLDPSMSKQSKGGHGRWVVPKVRKTVIRLMYLRYRIDQGMTRRAANQQLLKLFPGSDGKDGGQSSIRKATHSPVLDGCSDL